MEKSYPNKLIWSSLIILVFFIIDIILKNLFIGMLAVYRINFLGDFFGLSLQKNEGISYGFPLAGWIIISITLIIILVMIFIIFRVIRKKEWNYFQPFLLIIFGSLSNFIDRIKFGYVIDMLNLGKIISFNIADVMILGGAIWLIIIYIKNNNLTKSLKVDSLN